MGRKRNEVDDFAMRMSRLAIDATGIEARDMETGQPVLTQDEARGFRYGVFAACSAVLSLDVIGDDDVVKVFKSMLDWYIGHKSAYAEARRGGGDAA